MNLNSHVAPLRSGVCPHRSSEYPADWKEGDEWVPKPCGAAHWRLRFNVARRRDGMRSLAFGARKPAQLLAPVSDG